jgi:hypothetical protein
MGNIDCCDRRRIPFMNNRVDSGDILGGQGGNRNVYKKSDRNGYISKTIGHKRQKSRRRSSSSDSYFDSYGSVEENNTSVFQNSVNSPSKPKEKIGGEYKPSYLKVELTPAPLIDSPRFRSDKFESDIDSYTLKSDSKSYSIQLETTTKKAPSPLKTHKPEKLSTYHLEDSQPLHTKSSKFHISASAIKPDYDAQSISKFSNFTVSEPDSESISEKIHDINTYYRSYGMIEESSREYLESGSEYYEASSKMYSYEEVSDSSQMISQSLQEITEDDEDAHQMLLEAPEYRLEDTTSLSNEDQISISWIFKAYAQVNKFPQDEEEVDGFLIVKKKTRFNTMQSRFLLFSTRALYIMKREYLKDVRRRIDLTDIASLTLAPDEQSFVIHVKPSDPGVDLTLYTEKSIDAVNSIKTLIFLLIQNFPRIYRPATKQEFLKLIKSDEVHEDSTSKLRIEEEIRNQMGKMFSNL